MTNGFADGFLEALRRGLAGDLVRAGDANYDDVRRGWNGRYDRRPGAIARCRGTEDVVAAVGAARGHGVPLAIRGGGHSYAGLSSIDDGLLVDLSGMDGLEVDAEARTARVGPGVRWGAFDAAAQAHGLATTGGTVSTVGVSGYTLGGGTGYLARKHGLGLDNLIAAEVVTADGRRVRASESENADLFWALRGGGGNFGIVTSFEFRLHPVGPEVLAGQIIHRFGDAGNALRFYRDFMADAPDQLQVYAFLLRVPPVDPYPEEHRGDVALFFVLCYAGPLAEGEAEVKPLRDFGRPVLELVGAQPYVALQRAFDAGMPAGLRWYSKAHYLDGLSDEVIDRTLAHTEALPGSASMVYFEREGGAIGRVAPEATAFPHREAAYGLHIFTGWSDPAEDAAIIEWARGLHEELAPLATGGAYQNLLDGDEADPAQTAYGRNLERLSRIKSRWDPENLFRMNHNVAPGRGAG